jgi:hypothetical protein
MTINLILKVGSASAVAAELELMKNQIGVNPNSTQNTYIQDTDPSLYHEMIEGVSHWISTVTWIDYTWTSDTWVEL